MASLKVTWRADDRDLFGDVCRGVLTTDHAASSYGLPVLVRDDDTTLGPADLAGAGWLEPDQSVCTEAYAAHDAGQTAAADSVEFAGPWRPERLGGRKYRPEVVAMLAAARDAGYRTYPLTDE
jgi:hypothetical protein